MRTIAVVNQKGGAGKTTTAVNVAAALGEAGADVLLVDLDPQGSATAWLQAEPSSALLDMFTEGRSLVEAAQPTLLTGVTIVPAAPHLMAADRVLGSEVGIELALRRALDEVIGYQYVLVDCPPSLGLLVVAALTGCREVLVPVAAHVMELAGLAALIQTVETVRDRLNPDLRITGIVACRVDSRTKLAREVVESLRARFGDLVLAPVVRESVQVAEAPSHGEPITRYAPRSGAADDFRAVAQALRAQEALIR